jgi:molecular chaperone GrpE
MTMMKEEKESMKIRIPIEGENEKGPLAQVPAVPEPPERQTEESKSADQLIRLQAEFLNYKRRVEKEKDEIGSFSKGNLVLSILPVVDDFERLIDHHAKDETVILESVRLIYQKLIKTLKDEGLEPIESSGEDFNPETHEALSVQEVDADQDGKVVGEWQKGYRFKDRLIRPSRVKVGKYAP